MRIIDLIVSAVENIPNEWHDHPIGMTLTAIVLLVIIVGTVILFGAELKETGESLSIGLVIVTTIGLIGYFLVSVTITCLEDGIEVTESIISKGLFIELSVCAFLAVLLYGHVLRKQNNDELELSFYKALITLILSVGSIFIGTKWVGIIGWGPTLWNATVGLWLFRFYFSLAINVTITLIGQIAVIPFVIMGGDMVAAFLETE